MLDFGHGLMIHEFGYGMERGWVSRKEGSGVVRRFRLRSSSVVNDGGILRWRMSASHILVCGHKSNDDDDEEVVEKPQHVAPPAVVMLLRQKYNEDGIIVKISWSRHMGHMGLAF